MNIEESLMTRNFGPFFATLTACVTFGTAHAQQSQPTDGPIVRAGTTQKISTHVYAIADNSVAGVPNVGIIVGRDAILVVDTGMGKRNGETVASEARKAGGSKPMYLVTTHVHPEHDLGAQGFPAATKMIRSRAQVDEIAAVGMQTADAFRKRSEVNRALLEGAEFRKADVLFDDEHTLDLGGVRARLIAMGPNHTPGDTAIYIEQDGVLFSGDVAMKGLPAFASPKSSLDHWLTSLDRLESLKPKIVIPSHGMNGDASYIAAYREYLTRVRERTVAAKSAGQTLEQATASVIGELKQQYPDTGRMNGAIRTAYAEAR
jgi:glyoxylase-like metal-dependent hydrolase (beta-lactamase superfamily II)